jgi:hypothetical protein
LPGYFAGLLIAEMKSRVMALICLVSLLTAIPGALINPGWGWLASATLIAVVGWLLEKCFSRATK